MSTHILNAAVHWWLPAWLLFVVIRQTTGSWLHVSRLSGGLLLLSNVVLGRHIFNIIVQHAPSGSTGHFLAGLWIALAGAGWVVLAASTITRYCHPRQAGCGSDGFL